MKYFLKGLFFLIYFFSSVGLSAVNISDSLDPTFQTKLYFDSSDLEVSDNVIYIQLANNLIETNVIRTDEQGLYLFENDIIRIRERVTEYVKKWKCPYCNRHWPIGQKCQNPECPSKY